MADTHLITLCDALQVIASGFADLGFDVDIGPLFSVCEKLLLFFSITEILLTDFPLPCARPQRKLYGKRWIRMCTWLV
jgi:hypothetical protein